MRFGPVGEQISGGPFEWVKSLVLRFRLLGIRVLRIGDPNLQYRRHVAAGTRHGMTGSEVFGRDGRRPYAVLTNSRGRKTQSVPCGAFGNGGSKRYLGAVSRCLLRTGHDLTLSYGDWYVCVEKQHKDLTGQTSATRLCRNRRRAPSSGFPVRLPLDNRFPYQQKCVDDSGDVIIFER